MKKFFLFSMMAILTIGCNKDDKSGSSNNLNIETQSIDHDGEKREYILYLPSNYDSTSALPLLFNFHGFGGNINDHLADADLRSLADSENFILVYPQGTLLDGVSHWNPSLPGPGNKSNADDLGFVEELINEISSEYIIDMKRIYACGYSNGAMMSYGLALHKSDLISAVASVSGTMLDDDVFPSHPMPVLILHGTDDGVLPYNGSSDFNSVENTLSYWIEINNTNSTPIQVTEDNNGTEVEHYLYSEGDNGVSIEHYKIIDGGHVWFDIDFKGSDTNRLIWDFVSKYDINGLR